MDNIVTEVPELGILIGFTFKDGKSQFIKDTWTKKEFEQFHEIVNKINNQLTARFFCIDELFKIINDKTCPDYNTYGYDMKILATFPESQIILDSEPELSLGVVMLLFEEEPERTQVDLIDHDKWSILTHMMETTTPN